jgi:alanine racemase
VSLATLRRAGEQAEWPEPIDGQPLNWSEIDVGALQENAAALRTHIGASVELIAMVKSNGYGHGAVLASRAFLAGGATWLGVSSPEEAVQLRASGIEAPVLLVGWPPPATHAALITAAVDVAVWDAQTLASLERAARQHGRDVRVHLKVDTGMSRLGARPQAIPELLRLIAASTHVRLTGIYTHFADADGVDRAFTEEQYERFLGPVTAAHDVASDVFVHCANSAATLLYPHMHQDAVRPGIALYGYAPPGATGIVAFRPAMTVIALVTQVKTVTAGETVGYGRTWQAPRDMRVATVAAGYGDGFQRAQSNAGQVLIQGARCPVVGRVSMDLTTVDVSAVEGVIAGDEAVIVGGREGGGWLGADEVAAAASTISYEVLCGVSARVPRFVTG